MESPRSEGMKEYILGILRAKSRKEDRFLYHGKWLPRAELKSEWRRMRRRSLIYVVEFLILGLFLLFAAAYFNLALFYLVGD